MLKATGPETGPTERVRRGDYIFTWLSVSRFFTSWNFSQSRHH